MDFEKTKYDRPERYKNRPLSPKKGVQLHCPKCEHNIIASDININKGLAKCSNCNNVFTFEEEVKTPLRKRQEILMPEEIEIDEYEEEMTLFYKWRKAKGISPFMVFFGVFWNLMVIPFVVGAIMSGSLIMLLGISVHLLVGIGFLIYIVTRMMNTTYITVDDYELSIEHRPFAVPFIAKNQYYSVQEFDQLFSKKYVSHNTNGQNVYAYGVFARLKNGNEIKIIAGFKHKNKALFIEQELNINDQNVAGEV